MAPFMLPLCQFHFVAVVEGDENLVMIVDSEWAKFVSLLSMV